MTYTLTVYAQVPRPARDAAPAGEPVPGTEVRSLSGPTRGKGKPASTGARRPRGGPGTGDTSR